MPRRSSWKSILLVAKPATTINYNHKQLNGKSGQIPILSIGIVVVDIAAAIEFFTELGLELEKRAPIEGAWTDSVTGLRGMLVQSSMMRTLDCHIGSGN